MKAVIQFPSNFLTSLKFDWRSYSERMPRKRLIAVFSSLAELLSLALSRHLLMKVFRSEIKFYMRGNGDHLTSSFQAFYLYKISKNSTCTDSWIVFFCRASFLSVIKVVLSYCLDLIHLPPIFWVKRFQMQRLFFNVIDIEDRKKVCNLQMIFKRKWPVVCHFPMWNDCVLEERDIFMGVKWNEIYATED